MDFVASAESKFPLLFGREAQIRKFKKFQAQKLEYQNGARGGKYSELGTRKDIFNKLSKNKLLERRNKKNKKKYSSSFKRLYTNSTHKSGLMYVAKGENCKTLPRYKKKTTKMDIMRSYKSNIQELPFEIEKITTEGREKIKQNKYLKRAKSFQHHVTTLLTSGGYKESVLNSMRNDKNKQKEQTKKYCIKKCKSGFFYRKKKVPINQKYLVKNNEFENLRNYMTIKSYRQPTGKENQKF